ncbi:MAG: efflux RND transporter periplasmic adaptor subunit [Pseudomonadota bacterium]
MLNQEKETAAAPWPSMRDDLQITRARVADGGGFLVTDLASGELFEFSQEDYFLLRCMDGRSGAEMTIHLFEQRFGQRITPEQLRLFIAMVDEWGLLRNGGAWVDRTIDGQTVPDSPALEMDPDAVVPVGAGAERGGRRRGGAGGPRGRARPIASADDASGADYEAMLRSEVSGDGLDEDELAGMLGDDFGLGGGPGGRRRGRGRGARGGMGGAASLEGGGGFGGGGRFGGGARAGAFGGGGGGPGDGDGGAYEIPLGPGAAKEGDGPWAAFEADEKRIAFTLFRPQGLFRFIASTLMPFRIIFMLLPLIAGIGLATVLSNYDVFAQDVARERGGIPLVLRLIFSFLTVNLVTEISRGVIGAGLGGEAYKFGIRMFLGLIPRFYTAVRGISWFTRRDILWLYGGPILARLVLFGIGVVTWWGTRGDGTLISTGAILLSVVSVISLIFSSNPLARNNDGYHVLAAILQIPDLRKRANRALMAKIRGKKVPGEETDPDSERALRAYAAGSMLFVLIVIGIVLFIAAQWLETEYQGTGVAIFLALMLYIVLHLRGQIRQQKARVEEWKAEQRAERVRSALAQRRGGGVPALPGPMMGGGGAAPGAVPGGAGAVSAPGAGAAAAGGGGRSDSKPKSNPLVGWILIAVLGVIAVLPYNIQPGGPVRIMPSQQRDVHSEISGIVEEVYVSGGQYVAAEEIIARITNAEEQRKVSTTNASIAEQQAVLEELIARPRPEDVRLARQELETARVQLQFSAEEVDRLKKLSDEGFVSKDEYQEAVKKRDVDRAQVAEEEANLTRVSTPAHPKEIEAAEARLSGLREELSYYQGQLERTELRMPFDGRVVTLNLEDKEGRFLDKGEFFATVENAESVRVQFKIPQSDVSEIGVGGSTLVKFYSYPNRTFEGEIVDISTAVEEEEAGEVVIVTTVIPNEDGLLKTGMTGFGKVQGEQKTVIEAFSRAIVRFFLVEMWSWLP